MADKSGDEVTNFYTGKSIFMTGATGFIGKALIEKLLRSCSGVASIYVLIRQKKGHDINDRIEELINNKLFDTLRNSTPESLKKIIPIVGDISLPEFGISPEDAAILQENVSIVFHSAATVRFDEHLKQSVQLNVTGTKTLVEICRKIKRLTAVVHVSTAYAHCQQKETKEILYPSPMDPEVMVNFLQKMDDETVSDITPILLRGRPNTYTYTKAIGEQMFAKMAQDLPSAIVRPSIVTPTWKEPVPGWMDNYNGPTSLVVAAGKGVIRSTHGSKESIADFIPVDILVNNIIVAAWRAAHSRSRDTVIYNCTTSTVNPVKWETFERVIRSCILCRPFEEVVWYPDAVMYNSRFMHWLSLQTWHMGPAHILDLVCRLCGKKPWFVKLQRRIWQSYPKISFFMHGEWIFPNDNVRTLHSLLGQKERNIFNLDVRKICWEDYFKAYYEGVRIFILKEKPSKLPHRHTKLHILYRCSQLVRWMFVFFVFRHLIQYIFRLLGYFSRDKC